MLPPPSLSVSETNTLLYSHHDTVLESGEDDMMTFDDWSSEGSPERDMFSRPIPADHFPEERSTLVAPCCEEKKMNTVSKFFVRETGKR